MTPSRHKQIGELFHAALRVPQAERKAFLRKECVNDSGLLIEVESLLAFEDESKDFLKSNCQARPNVKSVWRSASESGYESETPDDDSLSSQDRPKTFDAARDIGFSRRHFPNRTLRSQMVTVVLGLLMVVAGVLAWNYIPFRQGDGSQSDQATFISSKERSLSYSITVQRNPGRYSGSAPFRLTQDTILTEGDQLRFVVSTTQSGFLYIINQRPPPMNGKSKYNALFPEVPHRAESAKLQAHETVQIPLASTQPELDWFVLDSQAGVETIWLIWATSQVTLLEDIKVWVNPQSKGEIGDAIQINALTEFLQLQQAKSPGLERRNDGQWTTLKMPGDLLVAALNLEHR